MKKICEEKTIKTILLIFLILQPILDCFLLYTDEVISFFHFSPTTIIRILIIAFLFVLLFFNKKYKQNRRIVYIYGALILVYSVLHFIVGMNVDNSGYKTFSYSVVTELFYIVRMLLPIAVIYITYNLKFTKEEYIQLVLKISALVSIIMIGLNLFVIARASYGGGTIQGNFFDWFLSNEFSKQSLASKGWFNSANQISGLMYILLPICIYSLLEKITKPRILIIFGMVVSMMMLGTRVASYGWFLIFVMMFILYIFFCFIIKNYKFELKKLICLLIIFAVSLGIMTHAPLVNTGTPVNLEDEEELEKLKQDDKIPVKEMLGYIGMNEIYFERIYPYEDHKKFWKYVVYDVPATKRVGNRNSQQLITDDVSATYENVPNAMFGLGYSRFINAYLYLEKDFIIHFYTIGIFGILLFLFPYILIALYAFIKMIKNKTLNLFSLTVLITLLLPLGISFFSGHIVDELIITLYLGFIAGYLLYNSRKEIKNEEN